MTPSDSVALARYVRAHFPQQPIDEYTSEALLELLAEFDARDARTAVLTIAKRGEHWCAPTDILAGVRRIRAKRISDHAPLLPPPGLGDGEERRWLAAAIKRVGDGEVIDCTYGELVTGSQIKFRELLPTPDTTTEETA